MSTFIDASDYRQYIKDRRLNQIIDNNSSILDDAESTAIATVKDALFVLYDTDDIFSQTGSSRAVQVVKWCVDLALYYVYKRIPDGLIPDNVIRDYERTLDVLDMIEDAKKSVNLPRRMEEDNNITKFIWGSQPPRQHNVDGP